METHADLRTCELFCEEILEVLDKQVQGLTVRHPLSRTTPFKALVNHNSSLCDKHTPSSFYLVNRCHVSLFQKDHIMWNREGGGKEWVGWQTLSLMFL